MTDPNQSLFEIKPASQSKHTTINRNVFLKRGQGLVRMLGREESQWELRVQSRGHRESADCSSQFKNEAPTFVDDIQYLAMRGQHITRKGNRTAMRVKTLTSQYITQVTFATSTIAISLARRLTVKNQCPSNFISLFLFPPKLLNLLK